MKAIHYISIIAFVFMMLNCKKLIEFDLPDVEQTIVIEGQIESGIPPIVFITRTQGYFDSFDSTTFDNIFIHNANVSVYDGFNNYPLIKIVYLGIPVYTHPTFVGENGRNYVLTVVHDGDTLTAKTQIPYPVPLDSLWFEVQPGMDSLGFLWTKFIDPDTLGNCYRWFSQRLNSYTYNYDPPFDNVKGRMKDTVPVAPFGSSTDDKFFNGLAFEFAVSRGEIGNFEGPDDEGLEEGLFKVGDTVLVKSTSITYPTYLYVRTMEDQAISNGSPFAASGNLPYNIEGNGIGIWAGYGIYYDTVICQ